MKILLLVIKHQLANLEPLYAGIAEHADVDLRHLDSAEQSNLGRYFQQHIKTSLYDRIILLLRFKREIRQVGFIRTIPNLVILEHDGCQNYYPESKYYGKFSRHYNDLPWARVLISGFQVTKKLESEGHDSWFIPKPYDQTLLSNLQLDRDIEFGFVGTLNNSLYSKRTELLEAIGKHIDLKILTTQPGQDYLDTLNRISYFISADIGFGEYMTKNFEAMACGCTLITWNQGEAENGALGFVDMENVVLYNSVEELINKLGILQQHPKLAAAIALQGQQLVEREHNCSVIGKKVVAAITAPLRQRQRLSRFDRFKYLLRR